MSSEIKYLSVCSGMEAATVAWHHLGWKPVGFAEIEPFPSAILKHHYPTIPNYNDLTKHTEWPIEPGAINLLVGGTPCQSYSVAGKRAGLNDPRGQLMLSFLDLAERLKPRWIVWENVPGVLSSGKPKGSDFGCLLQGMVERGYGVAYRVLDARWFGVAQRRRRVFVVCCLGDWRAAAEVLSLAEGLSGHFEKGDKKRKGITADAGASVDADGLQTTIGTLCADTHPGAYSGQDAYTGRLIPEQVPFRKSKRATSKTDNESWVEGDVSNTLNNFDLGDTRTTHAVVYENHPNDSRVTGPHEIAPTVTSRFGTGGGNVPFVNEEPVKPMMFKIRGGSPVETGEQGGTPGKAAGKGFLGSEDQAFTIATTQDQWLASQSVIPIHDQATRHAGKRGDKEDGKGNGLGIGSPGDPMNTLTQGDRHAVAIPEPKIIKASELRLTGKITEQDTCPTLTAGAKSGDSEPLVFSNTGCDTYNGSITGDVSCTITSAVGGTNQSGPKAITFQVGNLLRAAGADPSTEATTTLKASSGDQTPCVAHQIVSPTITTCKGSRGGSSSEAVEEITAVHLAQQGVDLYNQALTGDLHCPLRTAGGHGAPAMISAMAVRRLTPVECERLQGFPDNYSQIPWKGKPAEQCPDGPRYKACGNSMAVPVMRWIGEQIAIVDAKLNK